MRITYIQLADIHKNRNDHEYIRESQTRSDLNRHLNKTKRVENTFYIDLYNKKADLKRYTDRTHIDIVGLDHDYWASIKKWKDISMSLDVDLMVTQPVSVYSGNITHNLTKMAEEVKIPYMAGTVTLYTVLWRPEELQFTKAREIADLLDYGWNILLAYPDKFKQFNPENGWGSYDGLCDFVYKYRNACWDNPEAELRVSR